MEKRSVNVRGDLVCMIALLAVVAVAVPAEARKVEYVDEVSRMIPVDPDVTLVLSNTSGDTEITSWARNEIRIIARKVVRARSMDEAKEYADDLQMKIRGEGTRQITVETKYPEWGGGGGVLDLLLSKSPTGEIDYEIMVPTKASIVVTASSGDIVVEETGGSLVLSVTSGDVSVRETKGQLAVAATSGEIDLGDVRGDTRVSATTGDVTAIGIRGALVVGVTSGDIHCQDVEGPIELGGSSSTVMAMDCSGMLTVLTSSGDVEIGDHTGGVLVRTSEGYVDAEIESLEGEDCDITTSSGDVDLQLAESGSYEFVIETVNGEVEIGMPEDMEVQASRTSVHAIYRGGGQMIRVSTITGSIYIEAM